MKNFNSGLKTDQTRHLACLHMLKGCFSLLNVRPKAPGEGLGALTWMPIKRCCSWDGAVEGCPGAGGSSCCVLDYQHSTEGGVRSGTQHPGSVLLLGMFYLMQCGKLGDWSLELCITS